MSSEALKIMDDVEIDNQVKNNIGRATLYRPEMCQTVKDLVSQGYTYSSIADKLNISEEALYVWKRERLEFKAAFERGEKEKNNLVQNALLKRAKGYEYEEIITDTTGFQKTTRKHIPGDVVAQQVWLYNRDPENWKSKVNNEASVSINFQLPEVRSNLRQALTELERLQALDVSDFEVVPD